MILLLKPANQGHHCGCAFSCGLNHTYADPIGNTGEKWSKTMKVTNRMRARYPMLADAQIIENVKWNRAWTKASIKRICGYTLKTLGVMLVAVLLVAVLAAIAAMIDTCFLTY